MFLNKKVLGIGQAPQKMSQKNNVGQSKVTHHQERVLVRLIVRI